MYAIRSTCDNNYYLCGWDIHNHPCINRLEDGAVWCFKTRRMAQQYLDWNRPLIETTYEELDGFFTTFEVVRI